MKKLTRPKAAYRLNVLLPEASYRFVYAALVEAHASYITNSDPRKDAIEAVLKEMGGRIDQINALDVPNSQRPSR